MCIMCLVFVLQPAYCVHLYTDLSCNKVNRIHGMDIIYPHAILTITIKDIQLSILKLYLVPDLTLL